MSSAGHHGSKRKPPERNVMKYLAGNSAHCSLMPANFTNSCSLANLACYLSTATKASTDGEDAIALTARVSCFHSRSPAAERIDRARRWFRTRCRRPCARGLFCLQRDIRAGSPTATESKRRVHVQECNCTNICKVITASDYLQDACACTRHTGSTFAFTIRKARISP